METFKPSKEESGIKSKRMSLADFKKRFITQWGVITRQEWITPDGTKHEMDFDKYLGVEYGENKGGGKCLIQGDQVESLQKQLATVQQIPGSKAYVIGHATEHIVPADGFNQTREVIVDGLNPDAGFNRVYLTPEQIEMYKNNPQLLLKFSPETLLNAEAPKPDYAKASQSQSGMALS